MSEQEFTDQFIAAVSNRDDREMRSLCRKANSKFGNDQANQLLNNCYAAIDEVDQELAEWVKCWFDMHCYN